MASSIETTSTTTTLKNNGNTYMSVDTNDVVALENPLPVASGGTGSTITPPALDTSVGNDYDAHLAVLTVKNNIVIATDYESVSGADMWYDKKDKFNRFRFEYVIGAQYKNDELTVTANSGA